MGVFRLARVRARVPKIAAQLALGAIACAALRSGQAAEIESGDEVALRCASAEQAPWPASAAARRALIDALEQGAQTCSNRAGYLSLLGGLWLEEGDAGRALIWLERAVLLAPSALGARADYALALAVLGEPAARDQMLLEFRDRTDVPPALMRRLIASAQPLPPRTDADGGHRWIHRRIAMLSFGHENNLDRSPVLDGITLTYPDGPIELPLAVPIRPKQGSASLGEFSWRSAYDSGSGFLWLGSLALAARHAPNQSGTDWHYVQAGSELWRSQSDWRSQLRASVGVAAGPLNQPYRVYSFGAAAERDSAACSYRASLDLEARRQDASGYADGNVASSQLGGLCGPSWSRGWKFGASIRASHDRPVDVTRPGGAQIQWVASGQASGRLGPLVIEASARLLRSRDQKGYSPLLESNAKRTFQQWQLQIDMAYPMGGVGLPGAEAVALGNLTRQRSNLTVFEYRGSSVYGGLRWRW